MAPPAAYEGLSAPAAASAACGLLADDGAAMVKDVVARQLPRRFRCAADQIDKTRAVPVQRDERLHQGCAVSARREDAGLPFRNQPG